MFPLSHILNSHLIGAWRCQVFWMVKTCDKDVDNRSEHGNEDCPEHSSYPTPDTSFQLLSTVP